MSSIPVIAVFDVGKTNKKLLLFDERYEVVYESSDTLPETVDEDGFPCEDIQLLTNWVRDSFARVKADSRFTIKAVNFSGYGASFVLLDEAGKIAAPLYNYLKPYPSSLQEQFYNTYGGREKLCRETASPALGSLNSGLQLYRLKYQRPDLFAKIRVALHLPNYLSYILSGKYVSEITSVGCHTHLWNFDLHQYHAWLTEEGISEKLAPLQSSSRTAGMTFDRTKIGLGLHDSSAALIPYLKRISAPFILVSTGTWSISLNPFNDHPLTSSELKADCLCYLSNEGKQVKAARLFIGQMHEVMVESLSRRFGKPLDSFKRISFDAMLAKQLESEPGLMPDHFEGNYHRDMIGLVDKQIASIRLVLQDTGIKQIYVDGGFAQNEVYLGLLASRLPGFYIQAANMPQASALGAAMHVS